MDVRETVERLIYPEDPDLARRILALFWSYERTRLRHSVAHDPLTRGACSDDAYPSGETAILAVVGSGGGHFPGAVTVMRCNRLMTAHGRVIDR
jgi:hypothetical protein